MTLSHFKNICKCINAILSALSALSFNRPRLLFLLSKYNSSFCTSQCYCTMTRLLSEGIWIIHCCSSQSMQAWTLPHQFLSIHMARAGRGGVRGWLGVRGSWVMQAEWYAKQIQCELHRSPGCRWRDSGHDSRPLVSQEVVWCRTPQLIPPHWTEGLQFIHWQQCCDFAPSGIDAVSLFLFASIHLFSNWNPSRSKTNLYMGWLASKYDLVLLSH